MIIVGVNCKKKTSSLVIDVNDVKEYKKILRTKINVLILYVNVQKSSENIINIFKSAADLTKGEATILMIDCNHG